MCYKILHNLVNVDRDNFFNAPYFLIQEELLRSLTKHELFPLVTVNSLLIAQEVCGILLLTYCLNCKLF